MTKNPGRVVTEADLASLIGTAWPLALTPSNLVLLRLGFSPLILVELQMHKKHPLLCMAMLKVTIHNLSALNL